MDPSLSHRSHWNVGNPNPIIQLFVFDNLVFLNIRNYGDDVWDDMLEAFGLLVRDLALIPLIHIHSETLVGEEVVEQKDEEEVEKT